MKSFGIDLAISPAEALSESLATGLIYAFLVVILAGLYFLQQRMVAARAAVSPTMSPAQQKLMQYLPVAFAVFQIFFLTGLVVYYAAQAVLRIGQQAYITRRFYGHEEALGRQAQRAGEQARELAKQDGGGGGGLFAQAKRDLAGGQGRRRDGEERQGRQGGGGRSRCGGGDESNRRGIETDHGAEEPADAVGEGRVRPTSVEPAVGPAGRQPREERQQAAEMSRPCRRPVARNGTE